MNTKFKIIDENIRKFEKSDMTFNEHHDTLKDFFLEQDFDSLGIFEQLFLYDDWVKRAERFFHRLFEDIDNDEMEELFDYTYDKYFLNERDELDWVARITEPITANVQIDGVIYAVNLDIKTIVKFNNYKPSKVIIGNKQFDLDSYFLSVLDMRNTKNKVDLTLTLM